MNTRSRGIIIGVISGALLGALIGWVYTNSQADGKSAADAKAAQISPTDWIRLGASILGVARMVGEIVKRT